MPECTWNAGEDMEVSDIDGLLTARLKPSFRDPPAVLYHYTDASGLLGIVETNRMTATHVDFLNDPCEIEYGVAHVCKMCDEAADGTEDADLKKLLRQVRVNMNHRLQDISAFFVASFSQRCNHLGQWRAYAEDGHGYCIGFKIGGDDGLDKEWLLPVEYDGSAQSDPMRRVVDVIIDVLSPIEITPNVTNTAWAHLWHHATRNAASFKHGAYQEEQEWRMVYSKVTPDRMEFRPRRGEVVPYVDLSFRSTRGDLELAPIVSVTTGPQLDHPRIEYSLRKLREKHGCNWEVKSSSVKYRS